MKTINPKTKRILKIVLIALAVILVAAISVCVY